MSLNYNFGPALGAELDYRRERINEAARGTRRVRRGRSRRTTRPFWDRTASTFNGAARLVAQLQLRTSPRRGAQLPP